MSKRLRTASVEAQIRSRSRSGLSARQIAKELGLSRQTVDRVLDATPPPPAVEKPRPPKTAKPAAPAADSKVAAADIDELRALMSDLARGLTGMAREAHSSGDAGAYATLAGKAQSAALAVAKLSPAAPEAEHEGEYVTAAEMAKAAAAARTAILERVARRAGGGE